MHARVCVRARVHLCVRVRVCVVGGAGREINDQF